jgi:Domain of unknown function (DUF4124)
MMLTPSAPLLAMALFAGALALPAAAAGIYKTLAADGTVLFTDMPAPAEPQIAEQPISPVYEDSLVARANTKVDLAEHAFAVARRSGNDRQRAAFYMKDVATARAQLMQLRTDSRAFTPSLEQVALR